jgi:hypothetical protein
MADRPRGAGCSGDTTCGCERAEPRDGGTRRAFGRAHARAGRSPACTGCAQSYAGCTPTRQRRARSRLSSPSACRCGYRCAVCCIAVVASPISQLSRSLLLSAGGLRAGTTRGVHRATRTGAARAVLVLLRGLPNLLPLRANLRLTLAARDSPRATLGPTKTNNQSALNAKSDRYCNAGGPAAAGFPPPPTAITISRTLWKSRILSRKYSTPRRMQ